MISFRGGAALDDLLQVNGEVGVERRFVALWRCSLAKRSDSLGLRSDPRSASPGLRDVPAWLPMSGGVDLLQSTDRNCDRG